MAEQERTKVEPAAPQNETPQVDSVGPAPGQELARSLGNQGFGAAVAAAADGVVLPRGAVHPGLSAILRSKQTIPPNRAITSLLREPAGDGGAQTRDAGPAAPGGLEGRDAVPVIDGGALTSDAGVSPKVGTKGTAPAAWATDEFKRTLAAVVLAESAAGQETDIRWIYFQRVNTAGGASGLNASSAYKGKGIWYRIWLYVLGDDTHGADALPAKKEFDAFKGQTIADFCTKNEWIQSVARPRAERMRTQVEEMFTAPETNPYKGWEGQGNLADFNNESNNDIYWKRARAYYWLQEDGTVTDIYVKVLAAGKNTQVLFNAKAIAAYWSTKKLPADVPKFTP